MKPKTLILMSVAIVCGLGASYMTSRLLAERQVSEPDKVKIFVARKNLNIGDAIKLPDEMFEEKEYLRGTEPRNAIDNVEKLREKVMRRSLRTGDFITDDDVFGKDGSYTLQYVLPPGFRAIGIRVSQEEIASGFAALPHSRVDIISTVRRGDDKSTYSQMLLEDVLVVAADTQMHRNEQGQAMPANVVTVAVKPEDALKIALGKQMGSLSLVLRKLNDGSRATGDILTAENLKHKTEAETAAEVEAAKPVEKAAAPPAPEPVVAKADPDHRKHILMIYEGDTAPRRTDYLLDKHNQTIVPTEVTVTPLAPPAPTAAVPPAPTPAAGAPPAPPAPPAPGSPASAPSSYVAPRVSR